jgi:hypothetical protein
MEQARTSLTVRAERQGLVEITSEIAAWRAEQKVSEDLLTVFIRHTQCHRRHMGDDRQRRPFNSYRRRSGRGSSKGLESPEPGERAVSAQQREG